ncbi:protein trichome birefringence-like 3 [Tasmannia lanceolata]|uniref:protein trichome birefringence-like 3 n=1 Tax=Tasmannia lanceolata TaxID=3420 RepID=UPI004062F24F
MEGWTMIISFGNGSRTNATFRGFSNGEEGFEELEAPTAYRMGLKTWANWVDSTVTPNETRVFFSRTKLPASQLENALNQPNGDHHYQGQHWWCWGLPKSLILEVMHRHLKLRL